jgi:hypothetical protein
MTPHAFPAVTGYTPGVIALLVRTAFAEGSEDLGDGLRLDATTQLHVDLLDAGDLITWQGEVTDFDGLPVPVSVDVLDPLGALLGSWPSGSTIPALVGTGTYVLIATPPDTLADPDGEPDPLSRWSVVVTGAAPGMGRVWATRWWFAGETLLAEDALDGSLFALADGGLPGHDAVMELRFDGFAGRVFQVAANRAGANEAHARGVAVGSAVFVAEHPLYLNPPEIAAIEPLEPVLSEARLDGGWPLPCSAVEPAAGGTFVFDGDVAGTAHVVCDTSRDGVVDPTDPDDLHLLDEVEVGPHEIAWDGRDESGAVVGLGALACELWLTVGEVHVAAQDVETSYEGFRLFEVGPGLSRSDVAMYWDDSVPALTDVVMPDLSWPRIRTGPAGLSSGDPAVAPSADVNARSWGAFVTGSRGDENLLDTWAWQREAVVRVSVAVLDPLSDADGDGLSDLDETCVVGTSPASLDTDGDGLSDLVEAGDGLAPVDTDGDGLTDGADPDDDGDGVPTIDEVGDTDGDGVPDSLDDDDDGDGVPTLDEVGDMDGDGVPDSLDDDDDGDGVPTIDEVGDTDGDGVPDHLDADDDGDGIPTLVEGDADDDGDGIPAWLDPDDDGDGVPTGEEGHEDTDHDGIPDALDADDDGDGVLTVDEDWNGDGDPGNDDTDGDGIPDYLDADDDGDGRPTAVEGAGDTDGDGLPDYLDDDDDGDGVPSAFEFGDTDDDGIPDVLDDDDDDDGIPTRVEGSDDPDGDGLGNHVDTDSDGDTWPDALEDPGDTDGDGLPDRVDDDDDGDGVPSAQEWGRDTDGDGTDDALDVDDDGDTLWTLLEGGADGDADGLPDWLDPDSDDDGIGDDVEGTADTDGDGVFDRHDLDSDADGRSDAEEGTVDTDGDGIGNWRDDDDDGDTVLTLDEAFGDTDRDGVADYLDDDDDDDGIPTWRERADTALIPPDLDGDFLNAWVDLDSDGDGVSDAIEGRKDRDADRIPDYLDPDGEWTTWFGGGACSHTGGGPAFGLLAVALVARRRR